MQVFVQGAVGETISALIDARLTDAELVGATLEGRLETPAGVRRVTPTLTSRLVSYTTVKGELEASGHYTLSVVAVLTGGRRTAAALIYFSVQGPP